MQPSSAKRHGSSVDSWLTGSHSTTNKTHGVAVVRGTLLHGGDCGQIRSHPLWRCCSASESIHPMPMCQPWTKTHILSGLWVFKPSSGFCYNMNLWTFVKSWNFSTWAHYKFVGKKQVFLSGFRVSTSELNWGNDWNDGTLNLTMKKLLSFP